MTMTECFVWHSGLIPELEKGRIFLTSADIDMSGNRHVFVLSHFSSTVTRFGPNRPAADMEGIGEFDF